MGVLIELEGQYHDPFKPGDTWRAAWDRLTPEEAEQRRQIIEDGLLITPDDDGSLIVPDKSGYYEAMDEATAKRVKARLLDTLNHRLPEPGYAPETVQRDLIPGLWVWGHKPMLAGQPRAGKSTLVAELLAALLNPGEQFMGHYEPADLTDDERARGVWLINAENPVPDQHAMLERVGIERDELMPRYYPSDPDAEGWLIVEHLEGLPTGAGLFDLRNDVNYDLWANRLVACQVCDGTDDSPPLAVIVDGLTAILGSDTKAYGEWYARFRQLMQELGVPNALVVVHSPMNGGQAMNGVESIAQADGTWVYGMKNVNDQNSPHTFWGTRRLVPGGIDGGRVALDENGRLRLTPHSRQQRRAQPETHEGERDVAEPDEWEAQIIERLREAGRDGVRQTDLTGSGNYGTKRREAVKRLSERALIASRGEPARGRGRVSTRWFLAEHAERS